MRCKCGAELVQLNKANEPIVRTRGFVFKADGIVAVCPSCKADVPVTREVAQTMGRRLLLFKGPAAA
jgi:hypothetical protein